MLNYLVGMCGNGISVSVLKTRTEAITSNPKFQFPWLFSKPKRNRTELEKSIPHIPSM